MTIPEFSTQFDILFNNVTSNQAPGVDEYEKSVFLTKAEKEITKNYFSPNSTGNTLKQGFDDSAKRQADFSMLLNTGVCTRITGDNLTQTRLDSRSLVYSFPKDMFIVINEAIRTNPVMRDGKVRYPANTLQVIPLRYDEYTREMSKSFKRPLKNQAWRLLNSSSVTQQEDTEVLNRYAEIIVNSWYEDVIDTYSIRYIKTPPPILLADFAADGLSIDGEDEQSDRCVLDPILHDDILQRAVELAKMAWTQTGQDNTQAMIQAGQRTE